MLNRASWVAATLLACGALAAPAQGYAPPQMKLKELDVSDQPVGQWVDLNGASLDSANGYELGVVLEKSGQHVLVELTALPEGAKAEDQYNVYSLCFDYTGTPGEVVALDQRIRYAGNGTYGVRMTVSDSRDASTACKTANPASAEGSFTVEAKTSIRRVGRRALVLNALDQTPKFAGFAIRPPDRAGFPQLICALDAVRQADGSLTGEVTKTFIGDDDPRVKGEKYVADLNELPRPGMWSCAAQQNGGGGLVRPPWSAPSKPELVREVWYGLQRPFIPAKSKNGPRFVFGADAEPYMAGARVTLSVFRSRCTTRKLRRVATARSRVGKNGGVRFRFGLPKLGRFETEAIFKTKSNISRSKLIVPAVREEARLLLTQRGKKRTLSGTLAPCI